MHVRAKAQQGGFSMVEILIAIAVTLIGLAGIVSLFTTTMQGTRASAETTEATSLAQEVIEDLRGVSVPDLEFRFGTLPFTGLLFDQVTGANNQTYERRLTVRTNPANPNIIVMRVDVRWAEGSARVGSAGGVNDHSVWLELARTRAESL